MKKMLIFSLLSSLSFAANAAPLLRFGTTVSLWDPPGDANYAPIIESWAEYYVLTVFSLRGTGAYSTWSHDTVTYTHRRGTIDAIFRPDIGTGFEVGFGGGLGFYETKTSITGDEDEGTLGIQALGDLNYAISNNIGLNFAARAIVPDLNKSSEILWQFGGGITGELQLGY
ncbi:hypothetical protein JW890_07020 [candidate division WOR-3 bacterium]|nr:hypothetical protein [candidate division WOR-3 bacterium]